MSRPAWILIAVADALALATALAGLRRGIAQNALTTARQRLSSPTPYLLAAYLCVAAIVTPKSTGESSSPLFGLSLLIPVAYALATLASLGRAKPTSFRAVTLGALHGFAFVANAAVTLAAVSPEYVPGLLR